MMLLPAGLLAFLAGFGGRISGLDAGVLLLQGLFVLWLWIEPARPQSPAPVIAMETEPAKPIRALLLRILQLLLAITLAAVGAWLAMAGIDRAIATSDLASAGLLTAMMLCPLLVLPIIGTGTELAQRNQSAAAVSAQVGVSLLNVFALLPLLVLIGHRHELFSAVLQQMIAVFHFTSHVSQPVDPVVIFPLAVWRVDVVMIIALGLYLMPIAIGKWKMTKLQGAALMLGYAVYLVLSLGIAVQKE
jgi:Ca2+/Na+ antiporter